MERIELTVVVHTDEELVEDHRQLCSLRGPSPPPGILLSWDHCDRLVGDTALQTTPKHARGVYVCNSSLPTLYRQVRTEEALPRDYRQKGHYSYLSAGDFAREGVPRNTVKPPPLPCYRTTLRPWCKTVFAWSV